VSLLACIPVLAAEPQARIELRRRVLEPELGTERVQEFLETTPEARVHSVLQFDGPLAEEEIDRLEGADVRLLGYLGDGAYSVSLPSRTSLAAAPFRGLQAAFTLDADDKLSEALAEGRYPEWARKASGPVKVLVEFHPDVSDAQARKALVAAGVEGRPYGVRTWAAQAAPEKIRMLAGIDAVKQVQEGPLPFLPLNESARRVADSNEAQQADFTTMPPSYRVGGNGVQIGICDTGIDENHDDFDSVTTTGAAGASRVYATRAGSGGHGTHVASIAGGSGLDSAANGLPAFHRRGHAPEADLGDYPSFGSNFSRYEDAILNDGTDVTNHSYVQSMTVYDAEAADLDSIVRGDATSNDNAIPARPQVWAAGNNGTSAQYGDEEGYYAVFTSAKNTLSVGSVDTRDGRVSDYSSLGPTFDGRIKPDVVAPGCRDSIASPSAGIQAASAGTQGYTGKCGTSMAAPVVTGIVGQLMEAVNAAFGSATLLPSTYKAVLVQTAEDQVKERAYASREFDNPDTTAAIVFHAGPDFATGFGLVDADRARALVSDGDRWREASIQSTGDSDVWCLQVGPGAAEVKATIAWDDLPGDTSTAETTSKLVNDLDLELIRPDGTKVQPWTLDPLPLTANPGDGAQDPIQISDVKPARRGDDRRNNVEMASVPLPDTGRWRVRVSGHQLPLGGPQAYSLATSHPIESPCIRVDFCQRFPQLCPGRHICERYPWVCKVDPGRIKIEGTRWKIDPGKPVPVDPICRYVVDCPGCAGGGRGYCPGWDIALTGLPRDVRVDVFNDRGEVVFENREKAGDRTLRIRRRRAGDQLFAIFTDAKGNPWSRPFEVGVRMGRGPADE
jgi:subtilisin family serine protease